MKTLLTLALVSWMLVLSPGCVIAQELVMPAVPITVEARVRDPEGLPVEDATVYLALPRYRLGEKNQESSAKTDKEGVATVSGIAQQDYILSVVKSGYYPTQGPRHGINDEKSFLQYAVGVQKIDLELRPILNPIAGIVKRLDRKPFPGFSEPIGFDLEVGDWVFPHGKGKSSDFIFTLTGYRNSSRDYDLTLTLAFTKEGDGITLAIYPADIGSEFKFPYSAPVSGYETKRQWKTAATGNKLSMTFGRNDETNYIFRIRTELDEDGSAKKALYGIIEGEIKFNRTDEAGFNISFRYALNPDWTRNLEFNPAKTASSPR
ncbi:MAG: carboxypeptidase-like regulatory domain-containing protein [Candidatus Didemnitutus sp.]|nr:carboxypeptidase-like regulatory domain-containing protein [Candidatus Didemnitutus sp.]